MSKPSSSKWNLDPGFLNTVVHQALIIKQSEFGRKHCIYLLLLALMPSEVYIYFQNESWPYFVCWNSAEMYYNKLECLSVFKYFFVYSR